jgi:hypothetical protein
MIKELYLIRIYSQIWLNLPKEDDRHFGYEQKFLKK